MCLRNLLLTFFILFGQFCQAQESEFINGDFATAQAISINRTYSFDKSPKGFGNMQEFGTDNKRPGVYFKEERNTAWFKFTVPYSGILTIEIKPHSPKDDYDWMLFKQDSLQKAVLNKTFPKLLRSNNSRNDEKLKSKTGLRPGFENLFESPGPGKSYSKPLIVNRGENLVLVVDNIYNEGLGFDLSTEIALNQDSIITVSGIVTDKETAGAMTAKITAEDDSSGTKIAELKTDPAGHYSITIPLRTSVNIIAEVVDYIFQSARVIATESKIQNFALEKPSGGKKLILYNIRFLPNKDIIQESSESEIARLNNFLKQQTQWPVKIIGHTNNNVFASPRYLQQLSFNRAIAVKNLLMQHGISEKRITCFGMGGKFPIVNTKDPIEGLKNLRVEIVLTGK